MDEINNKDGNEKGIRKKKTSKISRKSYEYDGVPPPQSLPLPSVRSYTIPRRENTKELLTETSLDSREGKDIIKNLKNSLWDGESVKFEFKQLFMVTNDKLEAEYATKRKEMRRDERTISETSDNYAFRHMSNMDECEDVCSNGLVTQKKYRKDTYSIGDETCGVYLCRCADVIMRRHRLYEYPVDVFVLVFKVMKGRLKIIQEQLNSDGIEPTPEFDGHISKNFQFGKKMSFEQMYDSSQMYLYEINLDNLDPNDDSAIFAKRPRQCLPYAVVALQAKQNKIKPITKAPLPPSRPLMTPSNNSDSTSNSQTQDLITPEFLYDEFFPRIRFVWKGFYFNKNKFFADIRIGVFSKQHILLPMEGMPNLCITQKISQAKLSKIFPTKIFRTLPCVSLKSDVVVNGFRFIHTEIHPISTTWTIMHKLHNNWLGNNSAGFCDFNSGIKLYILPTCELTCSLGITHPAYPAVLHCIFMKRHTVEPILHGDTWEAFIKRARVALRERVIENEAEKGLRIDSNLKGTFKFSYKTNEQRKIGLCINRIKRAHERKTKDLRKRNESIDSTVSVPDIQHNVLTRTNRSNSTALISNSILPNEPTLLAGVAKPTNSFIADTAPNKTVSQALPTHMDTSEKDFFSAEDLALLKETAPDTYRMLINSEPYKSMSETSETAEDSDRLVVVSESQEVSEDSDRLTVVHNSQDTANTDLTPVSPPDTNEDAQSTDPKEFEDSFHRHSVVDIPCESQENIMSRVDVNKGDSDNVDIPLLKSSNIPSSGASLVIDTASQDESITTQEDVTLENSHLSDISDESIDKTINSETMQKDVAAIGEKYYDKNSPTPPPLTLHTSTKTLNVATDSPVSKASANKSFSQSPSNYDALLNEMRKQESSIQKPDDVMKFQDISSSGSDLGDMELMLQANRESIAEKADSCRQVGGEIRRQVPKGYQTDHGIDIYADANNEDGTRTKPLPKAYRTRLTGNHDLISSQSDHEYRHRHHRETHRRNHDDRYKRSRSRSRHRSDRRRSRSKSPYRSRRDSSFEKRYRSPSPIRSIYREGREESPLFRPVEDRDRHLHSTPAPCQVDDPHTDAEAFTNTINRLTDNLKLQSHLKDIERQQEREQRPEDPSSTDNPEKLKPDSQILLRSGSTNTGYELISSDDDSHNNKTNTTHLFESSQKENTRNNDGTLSLMKRAELLYRSMQKANADKLKGTIDAVKTYECEPVSTRNTTTTKRAVDKIVTTLDMNDTVTTLKTSSQSVTKDVESMKLSGKSVQREEPTVIIDYQLKSSNYQTTSDMDISPAATPTKESHSDDTTTATSTTRHFPTPPVVRPVYQIPVFQQTQPHMIRPAIPPIYQIYPQSMPLLQPHYFPHSLLTTQIIRNPFVSFRTQPISSVNGYRHANMIATSDIVYTSETVSRSGLQTSNLIAITNSSNTTSPTATSKSMISSFLNTMSTSDTPSTFINLPTSTSTGAQIVHFSTAESLSKMSNFVDTTVTTTSNVFSVEKNISSNLTEKMNDASSNEIDPTLVGKKKPHSSENTTSTSEVSIKDDEKDLKSEELICSLAEWASKLEHDSLDTFCDELIRNVSEQCE